MKTLTLLFTTISIISCKSTQHSSHKLTCKLTKLDKCPTWSIKSIKHY